MDGCVLWEVAFKLTVLFFSPDELQSLYLIWLVKDTVALVNIVPPEALAPVLGYWDGGDRVKTLLVTGGQLAHA